MAQTSAIFSTMNLALGLPFELKSTVKDDKKIYMPVLRSAQVHEMQHSK